MCGTIILIPFIFPSLHNELMMVDALADATPVRAICLDRKHLTTSLITVSDLLGTYSYFWHMLNSDILSQSQGKIDHWRDFESQVFRTWFIMMWHTDITHPNWNGGTNRDSLGNPKGCRDHISIKQPDLVGFTCMHQFVFLPLTLFIYFVEYSFVSNL